MRKYSKIGLVIGAIVGILGVLPQGLYSLGLFPSMDSLTSGSLPGPIIALGIFFLIPSIVFSFLGVFGCNVKIDDCVSEMSLGLFVTVIILATIGWFIGKFFDKKEDTEVLES